MEAGMWVDARDIAFSRAEDSSGSMWQAELMLMPSEYKSCSTNTEGKKETM